MADEAVTTANLSANAASGDVLTAADTGVAVEVDATNVAVISDITRPEKVLLVLYENGGGAAKATLKAGDKPPAMLAGLGDKEITVSSGNCVIVPVEAARFMQNDGSLRVAIADQNVHVACFRLPRGT